MDEQGQDRRYVFYACLGLLLMVVGALVVVVLLQIRTVPPLSALLDRLGEAKWGRVRADLHTIDSAVEQYMISNAGQAPHSLEVLVTPDEHAKKYLKRDTLPMDPWGNEYAYEPPFGTQDHRIICYGRDGAPGGEGDDRDYDTVMLRNRNK